MNDAVAVPVIRPVAHLRKIVRLLHLVDRLEIERGVVLRHLPVLGLGEFFRHDGHRVGTRAFARAATERGMKDAFIEYAAPDGLLFRRTVSEQKLTLD